MEKLTRPTVKVDETAAKYMDLNQEIKMPELKDRVLDLILNGPTLMGVYKDTLRQMIRQLYDGLQRYEEAEADGRLVILDEPMRPLVWGDKDHNSIHCPQCYRDLMGGYEYAASSEVQMIQCPHCGCFVDANRAVEREEADTWSD